MGAIGAYAYDHSRRDTIASGVRVGGVDLGGTKRRAGARAAASAAARARCAAPSRSSTATNASCCPRARRASPSNLDAPSTRRSQRSREGSILARLGREVTGGGVDADIAAARRFDHAAVARFVAGVGGRLDRAPRDASIDFRRHRSSRSPSRWA